MLGERLSELRKCRGLTQASLARHLNISPSTLGSYENNRRSPSANILIAISKELNVSTDFLLTGIAVSDKDRHTLASCSTRSLMKVQGMFLSGEIFQCSQNELLYYLISLSSDPQALINSHPKLYELFVSLENVHNSGP